MDELHDFLVYWYDGNFNYTNIIRSKTRAQVSEQIEALAAESENHQVNLVVQLHDGMVNQGFFIRDDDIAWSSSNQLELLP